MENQIDMQVADIYDVWYTPFYKIWYVQLILLLLGALILYGMYKIGKRFYKPKSIIVTPYQKAYNALENLKISTQLSCADKYVQLTHIIKRYIEEEYKIPVIGLTDTEFIEKISSFSFLDPVFLSYIKDIFEDAEIFKFGNSDNLSVRYQQAVENASRILESVVQSK